MDKNQNDYPDLENKTQDGLALVLKGAAGAIPYAGGIVAEIIGELIPNQRVDRIVAFLQLLDQKVAHMEKEYLERQLRDKHNTDLFEDACFQASRALGEERLEYIANALANSLTQEVVNYLSKKKLMWLLGELNDSEVIILTAYYYPQYTDEGKEFWKKHETVVKTPAITNTSSEKEFEEATFKRSFRERLSQLELIKPRYKKTKRGEFPEFDQKTGRMKASGYEITRMGRTLVRFINAELGESE